MENDREKDEWIDSIFMSAKRKKLLEVPDALYANVLEEIADSAKPKYTLKMYYISAAAAVLLIIFNSVAVNTLVNSNQNQNEVYYEIFNDYTL